MDIIFEGRVELETKLINGLYESLKRFNNHWRNKPNVTESELEKYNEVQSRFIDLIQDHADTIEALKTKLT